MDEPQIQTAETSGSEKQDIDEVLDAAFSSDQQLDKPMDVDESFPTTSAAADAISESLLESSVAVESENKTGEEEAGTDDIVNETIEQVNFDKVNETIDEGGANNTLDYTERSINISQISCENQDDSNDAFDALKRDETDVLNEMKEEPIEKPESETPMETDEIAPETTSSQQSPTSVEENSESIPKTPAADEGETEEATTEKPLEENKEGDEPETMESEPTQTDLDGDKEVGDGEKGEDESENQKTSEDTENVQSPAPSDSVDKPAEEVEVEEEIGETTNEGKQLK